MADGSNDRTPLISINRTGWRTITISLIVIVACLVLAILAQVGLFEKHGAVTHPEPLTTLALVLAILAFFVQLIALVFQMSENARTVRRTERLQSEASGVLMKIETNSTATQALLSSQFTKLLDFLLRGSKHGALPSEPVTLDAEREDGAAGDPPLDVTPTSVREMVDAAVRAQRPWDTPSFFASTPPAGDSELERRRTYLTEWPTRPEAEEAVAGLSGLSPMALAALAAYAGAEVRLAAEGETPDLVRRDGVNGELADAGLARIGEPPALTDRGRQLVRVLPMGVTERDEPPDWLEEVRAPLLRQ